MCFNIDGLLRHCKNPTEEELMWNLLYADDISLVCDSAGKLREAVTVMVATFLRCGLTISTKKTKVLVGSRNDAAQAADSVITLCGDQLEVVSQFKYLSSILTSNCTLDDDFKHGVAAGNSPFQQFRQANTCSSRALTLSVKMQVLPADDMQLFQCIVISVVLYAGETWAVGQQNITSLAVFQMKCLRRICGISLRDHVPNVDILSRCNTSSVESQLQSKTCFADSGG